MVQFFSGTGDFLLKAKLSEVCFYRDPVAVSEIFKSSFTLCLNAVLP